jgi:hypothetical protein
VTEHRWTLLAPLLIHPSSRSISVARETFPCIFGARPVKNIQVNELPPEAAETCLNKQ